MWPWIDVWNYYFFPGVISTRSLNCHFSCICVNRETQPFPQFLPLIQLSPPNSRCSWSNDIYLFQRIVDWSSLHNDHHSEHWQFDWRVLQWYRIHSSLLAAPEKVVILPPFFSANEIYSKCLKYISNFMITSANSHPISDPIGVKRRNELPRVSGTLDTAVYTLPSGILWLHILNSFPFHTSSSDESVQFSLLNFLSIH